MKRYEVIAHEAGLGEEPNNLKTEIVQIIAKHHVTYTQAKRALDWVDQALLRELLDGRTL